MPIRARVSASISARPRIMRRPAKNMRKSKQLTMNKISVESLRTYKRVSLIIAISYMLRSMV
jgi:hypothetical protein